MAQRRQVVMAFDERSDRTSARLRGGKGSYLARMHALGLPVPPGFTVVTTVARAVLEEGRLPNRLASQLDRELAALERKTGKKLGDATRPLLLSVRSGAEFSMPGMMDTILNLGMDQEIRATLEARGGKKFADACYDRFISQYGRAQSALPAAREQLDHAIRLVLESWSSERAVAYRTAQSIPENLGTAVTVQAMVFGNLDERSGTGVAFSRDPNTGVPGLYGEFLPQAQGEDIVSGSHTPQPISSLQEWDAALYSELAHYAQVLEKELGAIADIEFTIESGTLYLLQCRPAKLSAEAAATFAVHQQWEKRWTKEQAVQSLTPAQIDSLTSLSTFAPRTRDQKASYLGLGIPASPGAVVGIIATSSQQAVEMKGRGSKIILVRPDTNPDDLPGMIAADGIVTLTGGATSHAAVVARQLGKPCVVGIDSLPDHVVRADAYLGSGHTSRHLSVCGTTGVVCEGSLDIVERTPTKEVNIFLKWTQGQCPQPRIDFESVGQRQNVCSLLVDVYLSEAMAHAARGTALAYETRQLQQKIAIETAETFACYLAIAVASELRNLWAASRAASLMPRKVLELSSTYGIVNDSERGDARILVRLERLSREGQSEFFSIAESLFRDNFWNPAYGGEKWANIAQAVHAFLTRTWPHGMFVDRVFDLRHNGGVLFDKHPMLIPYGDLGDAEHLLQSLLTCKARAKDASDLMAEFVIRALGYSGSKDDPWKNFSPRLEILQMWARGKAANLWKDELS